MYLHVALWIFFHFSGMGGWGVWRINYPGKASHQALRKRKDVVQYPRQIHFRYFYVGGRRFSPVKVSNAWRTRHRSPWIRHSMSSVRFNACQFFWDLINRNHVSILCSFVFFDREKLGFTRVKTEFDECKNRF